MRKNDVLAVIPGGGKGTRLFPLTKYRAKPAVPFGCKFRIIDIPISNCLNSGLDKIFILTQFNSQSLHRNIYSTYRLGRFSEGFVDILDSVISPGLLNKTPFLASMGIYVFTTGTLIDILSDNPPFTFYDKKYPIYTRARSLPGPRLDNCTIEHTLMADGCFIEKSTIKNAVIGIRTTISKNTEIENCVIMGADFYEPGTIENLPHLGIDKDCVIHNAIIDENARIGNNVKIINSKKKMILTVIVTIFAMALWLSLKIQLLKISP